MEYKDIYKELQTVLWGDEFAKTAKEGEIGVNNGYLIDLRNTYHFGGCPATVDRLLHNRVIRIFKKFADKLYLELKDKYIIDILLEICVFVGDGCSYLDMGEICGTADDPMYFFDGYKPEDAVEPKPEDKYSLIIRHIGKSGSSEYEINNYKYYEEAKKEFNRRVSDIKEKLTEIHGSMENYNASVQNSEDYEDNIDEESHFKINDIELLLVKRDK